MSVRARVRLPDGGRRPEPTTPGRPLDAATRGVMERRFSHDFSRVRVHANAAAAAAEVAEAFSVGEDVTFAPGRFAPGTHDGDQLLTHELAHVVQQRAGAAGGPLASPATAEREAAAAARGPVDVMRLSPRPIAIHRQPAPPAGMSRATLAKELEKKLGHPVKLTLGTKAMQEKDVGLTLPATWASWDPGTNAPIYDEIAGAFSDVSAGVGSLPDITEVVFYEVHYEDDGSGTAVAKKVPAALRWKAMHVYEAALFTPVGFSYPGIHLPGERSRQDAKYKTKSPAQGTGPGAPILQATPAQSQRRAVSHELGHAIEQQTGDLADFEKAVGWSGGKLYDIKAKGVEDAIANGTTPPAAAEITASDWNSPKHKEQPLRAYQTATSQEDFADSLMAWIYARDVLKARSPVRWRFFEDHKGAASSWAAKLVPPGGKPTTPPASAPAKKDGG